MSPPWGGLLRSIPGPPIPAPPGPLEGTRWSSRGPSCLSLLPPGYQGLCLALILFWSWSSTHLSSMAPKHLSLSQLSITGNAESFLLHGLPAWELHPNLHWPLAHGVLSSFVTVHLLGNIPTSSHLSPPWVQQVWPCFAQTFLSQPSPLSPSHAAVSVLLTCADALSPLTLLTGCCPGITAGCLRSLAVSWKRHLVWRLRL